MGFTTGFTGGVAVTLGLTYLALRSHQRMRETQSEILRSQSDFLDRTVPLSQRLRERQQQQQQQGRQRTDPSSYAETPLSLSPTGRHRGFVSTAKERWNREVESAVRWAQRIDWDEVREDLEDGANKAWALLSASDGSGGGVGSRSPIPPAPSTPDIKEKAEEKSGWLWTSAKAKGEGAEKKAEETADALLARAKGGIEAGKNLLGRAKDVVISQAGGTIEAVRGAIGGGAIDETPVQKALRQRFQRSAALDKTVAQVLEERYVPMDKRDDTVLRGL